MAKNILVLRWLLPPLLLFGLWGVAYAGADPWPTDWLPRFNKVRIDGHSIVFDAAVTQIRLRDGQWHNASGSPINTLAQKQDKFVPRRTECSIPQETLSRYKNEYKEAEVVYCDLPDRIWFATGGYCGEGDDEPNLNQGYLYSYSPGSGEVQEYPGFLPRCAELAGLTRIDKALVAVTLYQGEYSRSSGNVLILDLEHLKTPPKVLTNPNPTGAVVGMSAYEKQCDCLWFATEEGIERLTLSGGKWEQRYLDYEITSDNQFVLTLSPKKPSAEKMWLGRVLYSYPIEDPRGFVAAWNQSPASEYDNPRIGPLMLPFYIAAIEHMNEGWSDWYFAGLMGVVAAHQDSKSRVMVRALIEKLLKQPMSLSRREEVVSSAKKFGVADAKKLEDAYFDALLDDYFLRSRPSYINDVVEFSFKHPEYLPKLRDYYLTHTITFSIERYFLGRVQQYRAWPGYDAAMITQWRTRHEHRQQLLGMCYQEFPSEDDNKLLALLQARLETDAQAKLMSKTDDFYSSCIRASRRWINGDEAKVRARVALMLDVVVEHKELSPIALEILNDRFSTHFQNIEEWKRWWSFDTGDGCSKEMAVCRFWQQRSCVFVGIPDTTSMCDMACQAEVSKKLSAADGITAYTDDARFATSPLGCVDYRKDLGGTEEGAKCIATLLGYTYDPFGCYANVYTYNPYKVHIASAFNSPAAARAGIDALIAKGMAMHPGAARDGNSVQWEEKNSDGANKRITKSYSVRQGANVTLYRASAQLIYGTARAAKPQMETLYDSAGRLVFRNDHNDWSDTIWGYSDTSAADAMRKLHEIPMRVAVRNAKSGYFTDYDNPVAVNILPPPWGPTPPETYNRYVLYTKTLYYPNPDENPAWATWFNDETTVSFRFPIVVKSTALVLTVANYVQDTVNTSAYYIDGTGRTY